MRTLVLALAIALGGCASLTTGTPANQTAINAAYTSYASLDQAILAADAAVKAGALKGADATNTLTALTAAKSSLDIALTALKAAAAVPATPASGATK
jgi:uncharacterized protein YceK